MRAMEEYGKYSYVSILFKATSFTDFLAMLSDVNSIMEYDKQLENDYIEARENTEAIKAEYEATLKEQSIKKEELEASKKELETQIEQAIEIISELENNIEEFKKQYDKNAHEEAQIQNSIYELTQKMLEQERKRQEQQNNHGSSGGVDDSKNNSFTWPCPSCKTTGDRFGMRMHPIFRELRPHNGVDIPGCAGSELVAIGDGTVQLAQYSNSYGNYVVIYHHSGISSLYAHMSSMSVSAGDQVTKGQTIGYVGSTGWATGPHLHFEISVNSQRVDPMGYINP